MYKLCFLTCLSLVVISPSAGMAASSGSPATDTSTSRAGAVTPTPAQSRLVIDEKHRLYAVLPKLETLMERLEKYNYLAESDAGGHVRKLVVSGQSSTRPVKPEPESATPPKLLRYLPAKTRLPAVYRHRPAGSVNRISLSGTSLARMTNGSRMQLNLPDGQLYELIQDEVRKDDAGGGIVWVGHLADSANTNRTVLSLDDKGVDGQITTPKGPLQVESRQGQTWLVDMQTAGLTPGHQQADETTPEDPPAVRSVRGAGRSGGRSIENRYAAQATVSPGGLAVIDLLVAYTPSLADSGGFRRKLNLLVALANGAFKDSKIDISLRLAGIRPVDFADDTDNNQALKHLTRGESGLDMLDSLRQKKAADAVILLRSFEHASQGGCGSAWVNGSEGNSMRADLAYAVVSVGTSGDQYCSNYTLAHEVGHILGATHDIDHTTTQGRFPYAYGYGIEGRFGDIMSYHSPEMGIFANPNLNMCDGLPCGVEDHADLARTFNATARIVSGFAAPADNTGL